MYICGDIFSNDAETREFRKAPRGLPLYASIIELTEVN